LSEKYEISYRLDNREASLIAPVVPHARPDLPWEPDDQLPASTVQMSLVCRMSGEAPGLITWLTVRNHRWGTGIYWQHGVMLRRNEHGVEALVEEEGNVLRVWVRGGYPNELFSVLRAEIEWLIRDRWANLDLEFLVPCAQFSAGASMCKGTFKFESLVKASQRGMQMIQCPDCFQHRDVAKLMAGFDAPKSEAEDLVERVQIALAGLFREIQEQRIDIKTLATGSDDLARAVARVGMTIREIRMTIGVIARDCPCLFTIVPVEKEFLSNPTKLWKQNFRLTLWCDHPGHWHPTNPPYEFNRPKEWFVRAAPVISAMVRMVGVLPAVSAAAANLLPKKTWDSVKDEVKLMEELGARVGELARNAKAGALDLAPQVTLAEGYSLRVLKELLQEVDRPPQKFAGLRSVGGPAGEVLWVCPTHYSQYDKGLPRVGPFSNALSR
jgi:internalin A